jgi:proteasome accessory factor C
VAAELGVDVRTLRSDLDVLLDLTEGYKPWLASLQVALTAESFVVGSLGAFRRPLRLSRDESLALVVGLVATRGGRDLAERLGHTLGAVPDPAEVERAWALGPTPAEHVAGVLGLARRARDEQKKLSLLYCGSHGEPSRRIVHPYQVVQRGGTWYVIAWCEQARGMRRFRVERVLEVELLGETFRPGPGHKRVKAGSDLLAAAGAPEVTVAFSQRIARWLKERYPGGREGPDGRYQVRFVVADPRWLAREVLQYGADAEVQAPEGMREFMRELVG